MRTWIAAIAALVLVPTISFAQAPPTVTLDGIVRDDKGKPLHLAEVIVGEKRSLTNAKGEFSISEIPAGEVTFMTRRIGYFPATSVIAVDPGAIVHLAIRLVPSAVTLGTIIIEGKRYDKTLWQTGFYQRRDNGFGTFFDSEYLARFHAGLSGLIATVPSVRIARGKAGVDVALGSFSNGTACPIEVFLDGNHIKWATTAGLNAIARTEEIIGIEVYPRASEMPTVISGRGGQSQMGLLGSVRLKGLDKMGVEPEPGEPNFNQEFEAGGGQAECGAMLIWTKRMARAAKKKS